ncbi:ABC transporter [Streptomyces sp. NPDC092370]|uniref:ABC transporter n=1 Tax=Streptomyces sp. NPDC092370 TaxID=3366016 RepID=UPI00381D2923
MPVNRQLVLGVHRTVPWGAVGAAGATGLLLAALTRTGETAERFSLYLLRAAILAFAVGLAFLLDDPARHTTAAVPTPRPVRIALCVALAVPAAAAWWTVALLLVPPGVRPPAGAMTLEAGAAFALAVTGAAAAVRFSEAARPGLPVAGGLLTTAVLAMLFWPGRWPLFVPVHDERWAAAHDRWAVVLTAVVLLGVLCALEPLRRRLPGRLVLR